jgi:hypothetical protein
MTLGMLLTVGGFSSADSDPLILEDIAVDAPHPMVTEGIYVFQYGLIQN